MFNENVIGARMWLFMIELIEGNVSDEEKKEVRNMLKQIIKKNPSGTGVSTTTSTDSSKLIEQHEKEN